MSRLPPSAAVVPAAPGQAWRRWLATALDTIIAAYVLAIVAVVLTGGIDLGWVSVRRAAKPILVLLVAIPLRLVWSEPSWLARICRLFVDSSREVWARWVRRCGLAAAVRDVLFVVLATQLATFAVGFLANTLFVRGRARLFAMPFRREKFAETFAAWDSGWFFDIARRGYYFNPDGQSSIAFFPLYPLLMRATAWPFGSSDRALWLAGTLVSCGAFVLGLLALHRLTERVLGDRETARRAVLYTAVFPFSFFFTRVYAEALFLLLTILAVRCAYDARWRQAGVWGGLATLTRPNGILIGLPLALIALRGKPTVGKVVRRWVALLPVPFALVGYCTYVYGLAGDPLAWLSAQAQWGYYLGRPPWEQLLGLIAKIEKLGLYDYFFTSRLAAFRLFHGATALLFIALTPMVFKRLGAPMGAYVLASLLIPLSGNALEGIGRYAVVLFPVFMLLGSWRRPFLHEAVVIVSSLFLAFFVSLFVMGHPIY